MTIDELKKIKIEAMKSHDKEAVTALNALISKLMTESIEKKAAGAEMTEADFVRVVQKVTAELTEEREAFFKAGRTETVEGLDKQIATVKKFLPQMLSESEIAAIIAGLDDKSTPAVMKHFKANYAGKVDMRLVGEVLKRG